MLCWLCGLRSWRMVKQTLDLHWAVKHQLWSIKPILWTTSFNIFPFLQPSACQRYMKHFVFVSNTDTSGWPPVFTKLVHRHWRVCSCDTKKNWELDLHLSLRKNLLLVQFEGRTDLSSHRGRLLSHIQGIFLRKLSCQFLENTRASQGNKVRKEELKGIFGFQGCVFSYRLSDADALQFL